MFGEIMKKIGLKPVVWIYLLIIVFNCVGKQIGHSNE